MQGLQTAGQDLTFFANFVKFDEEQRQVFGYASTETQDHHGETVTRKAIADALPGYMVWKNVREMHQPSAVGSAIEANMDKKGLWFGAKVVDDRAWTKVKAGVYKGFSVGGKVTARDPNNKKIITGVDLTEISLVDRPGNPGAKFELIKRVGDKLVLQPLQIWDCGVHGHQHLMKSDAHQCMKSQQEESHLLKNNPNHDEPGRFSSDLEKFIPRSLTTSHFAGHRKSSDQAKQLSVNHALQAEEATRAAAKHEALASEFEKSGDQVTSLHHRTLAAGLRTVSSGKSQLAGSYATLADHHSKMSKAHDDPHVLELLERIEKKKRDFFETVQKGGPGSGPHPHSEAATQDEHERAASYHTQEARNHREDASESSGKAQADHRTAAAHHETAAAAHRSAADGVKNSDGSRRDERFRQEWSRDARAASLTAEHHAKKARSNNF